MAGTRMGCDLEQDAARARVAYHEAGHAVAALIQRLDIGSVSVQASDDDLGFAIIDDPRRSWQRGDGRLQPLIKAFCSRLYAGWAAEIIQYGHATSGYELDFEKARDAMPHLSARGSRSVGD